MIDTPKIIKIHARHVALIRVTVPRDGIQFAMHDGLVELATLLTRQNIAPSAPWFTHHLRRPDESFDFEICMPVAQAVSPEKRVEYRELPAIDAVSTIYTGPYEELAFGWGEFHKWINESGFKIGDDLYETYLKGSDQGLEPAHFQTELCRPLLAYID